ncbi:Ish1 domain protein [Ceratobasidium sp. AG-Ba]|nr:Ish1 domain protein [Ceratobasidium sp. AG-Ba]
MKWFRLPIVLSVVWWFSGTALSADKPTLEEVELPVWSSWKDGDKRAWLAANGILSPKVELEEHEQGPEGLNKLLELYFFEEDETVYNKWSTKDLQMWLISRQLVPREEAYKLSHQSLLELVEHNFLSAEMSSCHGWTPAEALEWLEQNGHGEEGREAEGNEVFNVMAKYFNRGSDAVAEFMVWPDSRLRTFLRARGVKEPKKTKRNRNDLVHMVRVRTAQNKVSNEDLVRQLQAVLQSGAEWSEEQLLASLAILGGTKHRGAGKAMREASKFVMDSGARERNVHEEEEKLKRERNEL